MGIAYISDGYLECVGCDEEFIEFEGYELPNGKFLCVDCAHEVKYREPVYYAPMQITYGGVK